MIKCPIAAEINTSNDVSAVARKRDAAVFVGTRARMRPVRVFIDGRIRLCVCQSSCPDCTGCVPQNPWPEAFFARSAGRREDVSRSKTTNRCRGEGQTGAKEAGCRRCKKVRVTVTLTVTPLFSLGEARPGTDVTRTFAVVGLIDRWSVSCAGCHGLVGLVRAVLEGSMRALNPFRPRTSSATALILSAALVLGLVQAADGQLLTRVLACDAKSPCGDCRICKTLFKNDAVAKKGQAKTQPGAELEEQPLDDLAVLPGGFGAAPGAFSAAPSMIGDFFGNGLGVQPNFLLLDPNSNNVTIGLANTTGTGDTGLSNTKQVAATVAVAGGDRRFKMADNSSPLPRDRIFFNYHHFHNALTDVNLQRQHLDRYTFGLERTFWDQLASIEMRVPFAGGLAAEQSVQSAETTGTEFGNMSLTLKGLLLSDDTRALSAGLAMVFPTGSNATVISSSAISLEFKNESFYLQPFVGYFEQLNDRVFHQFFAQVDCDTSGSELRIFTAAADSAEVLYSQNLLYLDYQLGWWWYRATDEEGLRGIAPIVELHYTTTLEDLDTGELGQGVFVQNPRRDILNLTAGLYFQLSDTGSLKVASAAPLRPGSDKLFDAEFGVQYERRY